VPQLAPVLGVWLFESVGLSAWGAAVLFGEGAAAVTVADAVGAVVLTAAVQVGSSLLAGGGGAGPTPEAQKANIRQPVAPRRKYYGTVKIGGVYAFRKAKDGVLYLIIMLGEGEFSAFVSHWLDDVEVTIDGSNDVNEAQFTSSGVKRAKLFPQIGSAGQAAHAAMTSAWSGVWTSNHRLRGIANTLLVLKTTPAADFTGVYPQGIPAYRAVCDTAKVWDPRA
jgi:hypothetical protein